MTADEQAVPRTRGGRRVRMTAQERREQLIGVGRAVFAQRGYEAASIEEIAERAGVSKPVVYQHFGGKEGIYAVVVDREVRNLTAAIARAFEAGHPRLVAEAGAEAFLSYIEQHEDGFRVLVRDAPVGMGSGTFASVLAEIADRAEQLLLSEFSERGFDETTAPMYARMLVGAVALVGEWWLDHKHPDREVVAAHVVNLMWNGLSQLDPAPVLRRNRTDLASLPDVTAEPDHDDVPVAERTDSGQVAPTRPTERAWEAPHE